MSKIYTKTGDEGETSLLSGTRVSKASKRVEAYGTLDELVSSLGVVNALLGGTIPMLQRRLVRVQGDLMALAAQVACEDPGCWEGLPQIPEDATEVLEREIDEFTEEMPDLSNFILAGGIPAAACVHVSRTICRRAERRILEVWRDSQVPDEARKYVNRLADWLFTVGRYVNHYAGVSDVIWNPRMKKKDKETG